VKRFFVCALLVAFSVFGIWFAISATNLQPISGGGMGACSTNSTGLGAAANGMGSGSGTNAMGSGNGNGSSPTSSTGSSPSGTGTGSNGSASTGAVGGSPCVGIPGVPLTQSGPYISPAASSILYTPSAGSTAYSPASSTITNVVSCQNSCQTSLSKCQTPCYEQYNVTNQTQDWGACLLKCNGQLYTCSGACLTPSGTGSSLGVASAASTPALSSMAAPTSFPVPGVSVSSTIPLPQGGVISFALPQAGAGSSSSSSGGGGGGGGGGGSPSSTPMMGTNLSTTMGASQPTAFSNAPNAPTN
jgi:hypothetical protein